MREIDPDQLAITNWRRLGHGSFKVHGETTIGGPMSFVFSRIRS
jgi:hypothetical protein